MATSQPATTTASAASRTASPSRFPPVSSYAAAALGAAAAAFRLLGRLSDVSLPRDGKGKGKGPASDRAYDSDGSSSSNSSGTSSTDGPIDLIRGMRRSRRGDYDAGDGSSRFGAPMAPVDGLAAYELPMPVVSAYYWYF
ncbi:hypothetical protein SCUCBS95973_009303 [Sporothrix curviconia]|uniref:Uncharacterized protein n=1 Tax=Sporothrix curviconia TaxID=1260050 RepID=A0ABP0CTT2_9PEZI